MTSKTLDDSFEALSRAADLWKDTYNDKRAVAASLQTALASYQNYLTQLNGQLDKQLQSFAMHLDGDVGASDVNVLERLKDDFAATLRQERQLNAQMQSAYQAKAQQAQREHESKVAQLQAQLERAQADARQAGTVQEREVRLAQMREEAARDDAAAAVSAKEDAEATLKQAQAQQKSFVLANDRLKQKLADEQAAREKELAAKNAQLQQWERELREAKSAKEAAERRAVQAGSSDQEMRALQQANAALSAQLEEAKQNREAFSYSVQMANERLKEKLRKSEEDKVALLAELEEKHRLERELERAEALRHDAARKVKEAEEERDRALRYKDDWMAEVKRRVLLEEKGNAEAGALRLQLDQTQQRLTSLTERSGQTEEFKALAAEVAAARAEAGAQQRRVRELESAAAEAASELEKKQAQLVETQRKLAASVAESSQLQIRLKEERTASASKEAAVAKLGDDLKRAQKRLEQTDESLREEMRKSSSFQLASAQLEKELMLFKSKHNEDLHGKVQELLNTSGSMAQQLEHSSSKQEHLLQQLQDANARNETLRTQLADQEQEVSEISETARSWKVRCEKAEQALKTEEDANRALILNERNKADAVESLQKRVTAAEAQAAHERELREQRDAEMAGVRNSITLERMRSDGAIQELRLRVEAAEHRLQEAGVERNFQAWTAALEALAADDMPGVRRFLHTPSDAASPLDRAIRETMQRIVHAAETGQHRQEEPKAAASVAAASAAVAAVQRPQPAAVASAAVAAPQVDDSPQAIADKLRSVVEARAGLQFFEFRVVQSAPQANPFGRTLFLKVDIGDDEALWIRMYQTTGAAPAVHSAQGPKSLDEEMVYFDEWDLQFGNSDEEDEDDENVIRVENVERDEEDDEEEEDLQGAEHEVVNIDELDEDDEENEKEKEAEEKQAAAAQVQEQQEQEEEEEVAVKKSKRSRNKKADVAHAPALLEAEADSSAAPTPPSAGKKRAPPPVQSTYSLRKKKQ